MSKTVQALIEENTEIRADLLRRTGARLRSKLLRARARRRRKPS